MNPDLKTTAGAAHHSQLHDTQSSRNAFNRAKTQNPAPPQQSKKPSSSKPSGKQRSEGSRGGSRGAGVSDSSAEFAISGNDDGGQGNSQGDPSGFDQADALEGQTSMGDTGPVSSKQHAEHVTRMDKHQNDFDNWHKRRDAISGNLGELANFFNKIDQRRKTNESGATTGAGILDLIKSEDRARFLGLLGISAEEIENADQINAKSGLWKPQASTILNEANFGGSPWFALVGKFGPTGAAATLAVLTPFLQALYFMPSEAASLNHRAAGTFVTQLPRDAINNGASWTPEQMKVLDHTIKRFSAAQDSVKDILKEAERAHPELVPAGASYGDHLKNEEFVNSIRISGKSGALRTALKELQAARAELGQTYGKLLMGEGTADRQWTGHFWQTPLRATRSGGTSLAGMASLIGDNTIELGKEIKKLTENGGSAEAINALTDQLNQATRLHTLIGAGAQTAFATANAFLSAVTAPMEDEKNKVSHMDVELIAFALKHCLKKEAEHKVRDDFKLTEGLEGDDFDADKLWGLHSCPGQYYQKFADRIIGERFFEDKIQEQNDIIKTKNRERARLQADRDAGGHGDVNMKLMTINQELTRAQDRIDELKSRMPTGEEADSLNRQRAAIKNGDFGSLQPSDILSKMIEGDGMGFWQHFNPWLWSAASGSSRWQEISRSFTVDVGGPELVQRLGQSSLGYVMGPIVQAWQNRLFGALGLLDGDTVPKSAGKRGGAVSGTTAGSSVAALGYSKAIDAKVKPRDDVRDAKKRNLEDGGDRPTDRNYWTQYMRTVNYPFTYTFNKLKDFLNTEGSDKAIRDKAYKIIDDEQQFLDGIDALIEGLDGSSDQSDQGRASTAKHASTSQSQAGSSTKKKGEEPLIRATQSTKPVQNEFEMKPVTRKPDPDPEIQPVRLATGRRSTQQRGTIPAAQLSDTQFPSVPTQQPSREGPPEQESGTRSARAFPTAPTHEPTVEEEEEAQAAS